MRQLPLARLPCHVQPVRPLPQMRVQDQHIRAEAFQLPKRIVGAPHGQYFAAVNLQQQAHGHEIVLMEVNHHNSPHSFVLGHAASPLRHHIGPMQSANQHPCLLCLRNTGELPCWSERTGFSDLAMRHRPCLRFQLRPGSDRARHRLRTDVGAIAAAIVTYVKARHGRKVTFTLDDRRIFQAEGPTEKEVEGLLPRAKSL
jgi:hypothetical protein